MWRIGNITSRLIEYRSAHKTHFVKFVTTANKSTKCRKCGASLLSSDVLCFFCKGCSWPVESRQLERCNPFEIFNLPIDYKIDRTQLNQQYKKYQFMLHPDIHANKRDEELTIINTNASIVNDSYRTLMDDKRRAKLCFCVKYGEEEFNKAMETSEPAQLEEIVEMHEQIDALQDSTEARKVYEQFEQIVNNTVELLETAFSSDDKNEIVTHFKTLSFYIQLMEKVKDAYNIS